MKKEVITLLIGLVILFFVLNSLGIHKIVAIFSKINIPLFILACLPYFIMEILMAFKLKIIISMKYGKLFLSNLAGMFFSQITPGRSGYAYTSYSLAKKSDSSVSANMGLIALTQALMLIAKIIMIAIALIYFSFLIHIPVYFYLAFAVPLIIIILIFFFLYTTLSSRIINRMPILNKMDRYLHLMQRAVREISKDKILKMMSIDFINWIFVGLQFYLIALALHIPISFIEVMMLHPLITAILFIPISPNALGLAESGSALAFSMLHLEPVMGVAFLLLVRINNLLVESWGLADLRTIKLPKRVLS